MEPKVNICTDMMRPCAADIGAVKRYIYLLGWQKECSNDNGEDPGIVGMRSVMSGGNAM
jgi:hypothetical protein